MAAGYLVLVVGRSGVGKDSVLKGARKLLAGDEAVVFARRIITRPADPTVEDHDTLSPAQFMVARQAGAFALSWSAHGLDYALPIGIDTELARGKTVIANTSRTIIAEAQFRYPNSQVVMVTASPDTVAARLAIRGREDAAGVKNRLTRQVATPDVGKEAWQVPNDGPLDAAVQTFVELIKKLRHPVGQPEPANLVKGSV